MTKAQRKAKLLEWLSQDDENGHKRNADCLAYDFQDFVEFKLGNISLKLALSDLRELEKEGKVSGARLSTGVPYAGAPKHVKVYWLKESVQ